MLFLQFSIFPIFHAVSLAFRGCKYPRLPESTFYCANVA